MGRNWVYRIGHAELEDVEEGLRAAPHYEAKVASAIKRTMQMIHGIPDLHYKVGIAFEDVEVYLGRAGTASHLLDRWSSHYQTKGHKYATILFQCDVDKSVMLEGLAIRVLSQLKTHEALCVGNANVSQSGAGGVARHDSAIVYMTWSTQSDAEYFEKPGIGLIRDIAEIVVLPTEGEISKTQVITGLRQAKRLTDRAKLEFFPD